MNAIRLLLILSVLLLFQAFAEERSAVIKDENDVTVVYLGGAPSNMDVLTEHRVIVRYQGPSFRLCQCAGPECPKSCAATGEFANFEVVKYLSHINRDESRSDDKQQVFQVAISDVHGFEIGDQMLNEMISKLHIGDLLILEQKHLYGRTGSGKLAHLHPITLLKKITAEKAKALAE